MRSSIALVLCCVGTFTAVADPAHASIRNPVHIPAEPLGTALRELARTYDFQLLYHTELVKDLQTPGAAGSLTPDEALTRVLAGTGLSFKYLDANTVTVFSQASAAAAGTERSGQDPSAHRDEGGSGKNDSREFRVAQLDQTRTGAAVTQAPAVEQAQKVPVEEIIVSAQKREERLQDVPIPLTAITTAALADENQSSLQDYYSRVPGLSLTPNEFGGAPTIAIRGITSGDFTNPTVGIAVDDVPFGPSTVNGGGYFAPDLDPSDLARIEVLRGPQGTLYGASSMGGLLKYVTADPSTEKFFGRAQAGLSTVHNGPGVGYNVSGAVNVPLTDTFALRASAFTREEPGFVDNVRVPQRGVNKVETVGTHLSALWRPSSDLSVKLSALYQDNKLLGAPTITVAPGLQDLQQDFLPASGGVERKSQAYSATVTARFGNATVTSVTGYSVSQFSDELDYTKIVGGLTSQAFQTESTINTDNTHTNKVSQELRLATPIGPHLDWLLGGFYTHEYSPWAIELIPVTPASQRLGSLVHAYFDSVYGEWAAFTDLTYHLTDSFDIQLGGRESRILQTFEAIDTGIYVPLVQGIPSPLVVPETVTHQNAFTYLVTPSWKVSPDLMIYTRFASGFRAGGINNFFGSVNLPPNFKPDTTRNYELGAKGSALDRRLSFDASVYYIDWTQIQLSLTDPISGQSYFANGGEAKSQGLELSAQLTPVAGLHWDGWISWNDAVLTKDLPGNGGAYGLSGDRLPYSSRFSGSTSLDYELSMGSLTTTFGGTVSYVGARVGAFGVSPARQDLPGYTKTDLHVDLHSGPWTIDLYVNNVTDRRGVVGGGIGTAVPTSFFVIQPRIVGVSAARTF